MPFFGQVLMKEGLRPDLHKVDGIKQWPTPTNVTELQSFLGSVNYLYKFIPYLLDLRQPLQGHLKSDSEFLWIQVHDKAFKNLKQAICKDITLQFFDSDLPSYIEADAYNNLRPVAYVSKTLTSCESNYSNIERELLGVLFSVLHFKYFTYGCQVHIITDHKPLVSLFRKSLTSASPRLSRMLLHILDYQLDVMYQPGTKMHLSDALSRLTIHNNNSKAEPIKGLDVTVHDVQIFTEIKRVTENNPDLQTLRQYIQDGFPANRSDCAESVQAYFGFREELAIVNGLIVKGHRVVIPNQLHDEALKLLHSSHMGIVKTKDRARTSFFWPSINRDIESHLSECRPCATFQEKQPNKTLLNDPKPWHALAMDNFDFNGKHYLIVVDCFSKFVVVKPSKDLTSRTTINSLLDIFSEHCFPVTIRCDI